MKRTLQGRCLPTILSSTIFSALAVAGSALLILLSSAPAAHAQSNPSLQSTQATQAREAAQVGAALAAEFRKIASSTSQLDQLIVNAYGVPLTPEKLEIARRAMRTNLTDENLAAYMGTVIAPLIATNPTMADVTAAAMEGIASLQIKGLARLSPELQASFVTHTLDAMLGMTPADCKAVALGQMSTSQAARLERLHIARLPLGQFEAITNLYQEAARAELRGFPDVRQVNPEQARLAESVFENAAVARLRRSASQSSLERFSTVGLEGMPAQEACQFVYASNAAILDMPEPYRTWQLARFTLSMQ